MGLMGFLSAIGFLATAAASGWKDCAGDWTGCCKQDVKQLGNAKETREQISVPPKKLKRTHSKMRSSRIWVG